MLEKIGIDRRLKADFTWVLTGNVLYSACQWGIMLVLAKLGTPRQVGEYALGVAVASPVVLLANFQLRALIASDVKDRFSFGQYLTFRLLSLAAAMLLLAGVAAVAESSARRALIILLVGLTLAIEYASESFYGRMQRLDRMNRVAGSLMIKGPVALIALGLAFYSTGSVLAAVGGLAAGRLAVLLFWDGPMSRDETRGPRLEWARASMLPMFREALPLGVISTLGALNVNIPRYFIEGHLGSADLGMYSAIASLQQAGNLVMAALGQSVFLHVARATADRDRTRVRALMLQVALVGTLAGAGMVGAAVLFGRPLLAALFRPEYAQHTDVFVRLMVVAMIGFVISGMGYVMTAARSLKPQIPLLLASMSAMSAACAWLVPRRGLVGAADAALIASAVTLAGAAFIVYRIDRGLRPAPACTPTMMVAAPAGEKSVA